MGVGRLIQALSPSSSSNDHANEGGIRFEVEVEKREGTRLGIAVSGQNNDRSLLVKTVNEYGLANLNVFLSALIASTLVTILVSIYTGSKPSDPENQTAEAIVLTEW